MTAKHARRRGFNLVDLFSTSVRWKEHMPMNDGLVDEADFAMIRDLGLDFARIPLSHYFLGTGPNARVPDEDRLRLIDRVVEFGRRYDVHVMLALHRAPGYCSTAGNPYDFPAHGDIFGRSDDLDDFIDWWRTLARRYENVPTDVLSMNLLNEPLNIDDATFDRTFVPAIEAIHAVSPERLVHAEGRGRVTAGTITYERPTDTVLAMPNVISSVHIYHPLNLTHHRCPWAFLPDDLEPPTWPYQARLRPGEPPRDLIGDEAKTWDGKALRELLTPYLDLAAAGHPVHVGEMGVYPSVDHDVVLAYLSDLTGLLDEYDIGYALWNFRGPFGILDTGRTGPGIERYRGHWLDRRLLDLMTRDSPR